MLKEQLMKYIPYNEQEEKDKEVMISYLNNFDNSLTREINMVILHLQLGY